MTTPRLDELFTEAHLLTLGQIVPKVVTILPGSLLPRIKEAVEARNHLAHGFWFERVHLAMTSEGTRQLIASLTARTDAFRKLAGEIEACSAPYFERFGITDAMLQEAYNEALAGEDSPPARAKRRPTKKRKELVVAAYIVPCGDAGGSTLVFQTDDDELWQLCDVGLGWTAYGQVARDWRPAGLLEGALPAHINPRPTVEAPWTYEIVFKHGITLLVRPGVGPDQFRYSVRRADV